MIINFADIASAIAHPTDDIFKDAKWVAHDAPSLKRIIDGIVKLLDSSDRHYPEDYMELQRLGRNLGDAIMRLKNTASRPCKKCGRNAYGVLNTLYVCPNSACNNRDTLPLDEWNAANSLAVAELREGGTFEYLEQGSTWKKYHVEAGPKYDGWIPDGLGVVDEKGRNCGQLSRTVFEYKERVKHVRQGPVKA